MGRFWKGIVAGGLIGALAGLYVFLNMDPKTEDSLRQRTESAGKKARETLGTVTANAAKLGSVIRSGKAMVDGKRRGIR